MERSAQQSPVQKTLENLDELLIRLKNEHTLPGLAVGVVQDGELVFAKGYGLANIEKETPATPDTIFRIGSISKTFTAVGIMQLWEQGRFQLDDPVNDYLKAYKLISPDPDAPPITFRHLLTHTSGIGEVRDLSDILRPTVGLSAKADQPRLPLREYYRNGLRAEVYPGEKWAYANHAFATLGQLIEDISGQAFPDYMIEHVFTPLGMTRTDYLLSDRVKSSLAQGYAFKKSRFVPVEYTRVVVEGAGSIFSSVTDMSRYAAALTNGGKNEFGSVLKPETLAMMMEPQMGTDLKVFGMGLAFILDQYGDHRIAWHNGGWPGFVSAMYVAPDDRLAVLVFTNSSSPAPDAIAIEVMHRLLGLPQPGEQIPMPGLLEAPHQWPELAGFLRPEERFPDEPPRVDRAGRRGGSFRSEEPPGAQGSVRSNDPGSADVPG